MRGWGWGDFWGALVLLVLIVGWSSFSAAAIAGFILAGVLGYGWLNSAQVNADNRKEER